MVAALMAAALAGAQLPPDIMADGYLLKAEQCVREQDFSTALATMERLLELQREHGLETAPEDHYRHAQVWQATGASERALEALTRYFQRRGRQADHYTEALELMNRAEANRKREAEACQDKPGASDCWMELEGLPGCHAWNNSDESLSWSWSGRCADGLAEGAGTLTLSNPGSTATGSLRRGRKHGLWKERFAIGMVQEGSYVDGRKHGHWTARSSDGKEHEGSMVDGQRHGQWTERDSNGRVWEGLYVDDRKHGLWTERDSNGGTTEATYEAGERHGQFTMRDSNGRVWEGPYVDGKRHGQWTEIIPTPPDGLMFGMVSEGPYVDDKRHGQWAIRYSNGSVSEGPYVDGRKHGRWITRDGRACRGERLLRGQPGARGVDENEAELLLGQEGHLRIQIQVRERQAERLDVPQANPEGKNVRHPELLRGRL